MTSQVSSLNPDLHELETDSTKRTEYPSGRSEGTSWQHMKSGIKIPIQNQWNQEFLCIPGLCEVGLSLCKRDIPFLFESLELWVEEKRGTLHIQLGCAPILRHPLSPWQIFLPSFARSCPACCSLSAGLPALVQKSLADHGKHSSQAAALTREQNPAKFSPVRQDTYSVCIKQTCSADRLKQAPASVCVAMSHALQTVHPHLHSLWRGTGIGISPRERQEASQWLTGLHDLAENADVSRSGWSTSRLLHAALCAWQRDVLLLMALTGRWGCCCCLRLALDRGSWLSHAAAPPGCFYLCTGDGRSRLVSNLTDRGVMQKSFWKLKLFTRTNLPSFSANKNVKKCWNNCCLDSDNCSSWSCKQASGSLTLPNLQLHKGLGVTLSLKHKL